MPRLVSIEQYSRMRTCRRFLFGRQTAALGDRMKKMLDKGEPVDGSPPIYQLFKNKTLVVSTAVPPWRRHTVDSICWDITYEICGHAPHMFTAALLPSMTCCENWISNQIL